MVPRRTILICSTPRSGTTWLCDVLAGTGQLGYPGEYFTAIHNEHYERILGRRAVDCFPAVFDLILRLGSTPNGVFSTKLFWHLVPQIAESFHGYGAYLGLDGLEIMRELLPDIRVIRMVRRDKERQAISHYRAMQSNIWWKNKTVPVEQCGAPVFDFEGIYTAQQKLLLQEASWTRSLAQTGFPVRTVFYEDCLTNPAQTVSGIAEFLQCPALADRPVMLSDFEVQADALTDEWQSEFIRRRKMQEEPAEDKESNFRLCAGR